MALDLQYRLYQHVNLDHGVRVDGRLTVKNLEVAHLEAHRCEIFGSSDPHRPDNLRPPGKVVRLNDSGRRPAATYSPGRTARSRR